MIYSNSSSSSTVLLQLHGVYYFPTSSHLSGLCPFRVQHMHRLLAQNHTAGAHHREGAAWFPQRGRPRTPLPPSKPQLRPPKLPPPQNKQPSLHRLQPHQQPLSRPHVSPGPVPQRRTPIYVHLLKPLLQLRLGWRPGVVSAGPRALQTNQRPPRSPVNHVCYTVASLRKSCCKGRFYKCDNVSV